MKDKKTLLALIIFFLLLSTVFITYFFSVYKDHKRLRLPIVASEMNHHIHPFSFIDQNNKTVTEKDISGKICVVEYFYASCKDMCPKMNTNLEEVYKAFKGNKKVIILSHTVDPQRDTVAALKAYSLRFGADAAQWKFLTGDKKQLYDMARYSYLINADQDTTGVSIDQDFIHDKHYVLVDGDGRLRGFYDGLKTEEVTKLIKDIQSLLD